MAPVKPIKVIVNEEEKMAVVIVEDDKMSLAIGRNGQNLRLASQLTGYQIEPIKVSEYEQESTKVSVPVEEIEGIPDNLKAKLLDADILYEDEIVDMGIEGLLELKGIGAKSAEKIWDAVKAASKEENTEENDEE